MQKRYLFLIILFLIIATSFISFQSNISSVSAQSDKDMEYLSTQYASYLIGEMPEKDLLKIIKKYGFDSIEDLEKKLKINTVGNAGGSTNSNTETRNGLHGWAWSENIGWIDFSPTVLGNDWGPELNVETGYLNGWAWSENIGWVKFDSSITGPSGIPVDLLSQAKYDLETGALTGWAKVIGYDLDTECPTSDPTCGDNWADGWISFSGDAIDGSSYGVSFKNSVSNPESYAWGGPVTGWIDFSEAVLDTTEPNAQLTLESDIYQINQGDTFELSWFGENLDTSQFCTPSGGFGEWNEKLEVPASNNDKKFLTISDTSMATVGSTAFNIVCPTKEGTDVNAYTTITVLDEEDYFLTLSPSCLLPGHDNKGIITITTNIPYGSGIYCSGSGLGTWSNGNLPSSITGLKDGSYTINCNQIGISSSATLKCLEEPGSSSGSNIPYYQEN